MANVAPCPQNLQVGLTRIQMGVTPWHLRVQEPSGGSSGYAIIVWERALSKNSEKSPYSFLLHPSSSRCQNTSEQMYRQLHTISLHHILIFTVLLPIFYHWFLHYLYLLKHSAFTFTPVVSITFFLMYHWPHVYAIICHTSSIEGCRCGDKYMCHL